MRNLIITGTSGVGKSFLEKTLEQKYDFYPLVKFMDRSPRPEELNDPHVGFLTSEGFDKESANGSFAFTLEYGGKKYGWRKDDIDSHKDKNLTIAITLESLKSVFESLSSFCPILLTIDPENFDLITNRMKKRENYDKLDEVQRKVVDKNIENRINLAREEVKNIDEYKRIVELHGGRVFYIKDDNTIFDEVIPFILGISRDST